MADSLKKVLEPIDELQNIRGIELPIGLEFLQLVITGPPGAGKSYYIEQIRGWPNEGYLDLTQRGWWKDQSLVYRPREVHLGLPFQGISEALTVFDKEWLNSDPPLEIDYRKIVFPPPRRSLLQTDWRNRYIFEFLIPRPSVIYQHRLARQSQGYFPVDDNLSLDMVRRQVAVYREVALYLHRGGLNVYIRKGLDKPPMWIAEKGVPNVPRWTLDQKRKRHSLKTLSGWKHFFGNHHSATRWLVLGEKPLALEKEGRIAHDGRSFELLIGNIRLRVQPEIALGVKKKVAHKHWIINNDQSCTTKRISGFVRIKVGETIVIGRDNEQYAELFKLDDSVASRQVTITNHNGDLILTPFLTAPETRLIRLDDADHRERLERGRHKALLEIRRLYGQKIIPLAPDQALSTLQAVNTLMVTLACRPKDNEGIAGGLVELPPKTTPVIVGDLHAQVDNFLKILSENCLLDCLRMKRGTLILLGDAIHSENREELASFETSMLIMDLILKLKLKFPDNVFYIRGNHDSFSPEINKNGVLQGVLFRDFLLRQRGAAYVQEMEKFYNLLPYVIYSDRFIACHAGPPRNGATRKDLINIKTNALLADGLTKNRLQRPNHLAGYSKRDVKKFRKCLGLPSSTRFIVGHTPMDPFGSSWLHAGTIKNHHIIYSAHNEGPSVLIQTDSGFMPISFPAEPLTELINKLRK
ncbi:MAG: metallophosphoesterase [Desulforhopalus sp.]